MRGSHVFMLFTTVLMAAALSLRVDAESKYKACSLLTAAEAEAALDAKAARTLDGDMQAQGETVSNRIWGPHRAPSPSACSSGVCRLG
jgi:hypothetical protein